MMHPSLIPRSPFSTRLSGSAHETELRIRNIFQWKKKRPPLWLMALALAAILACGGLVSCQQAGRDTPTLVMDVQYYDTAENYIEIPALVPPEGAEPDPGVTAINQALVRLKEEYSPLLSALESGAARHPDGLVLFENHCLLYPTETDRYLNLILFREEFTTDLTSGHVTSLVYDKEEKRQVTIEEALELAGQTEEGLYARLSEQFDGPLPEVPALYAYIQEPALEGFRMGGDGQPVFYLTARLDDDPARDQLSGSQNLYLWADGSFTLYDQYAPEPEPLVPADQCLDLDPPLWRQWHFGVVVPEGGFTASAGDQMVRAEALARQALEDYAHLDSPQLTVLVDESRNGRSLMLVRVEGYPHAGGLSNLCLGVWDQQTRGFSGEVYAIRGDRGLYSFQRSDSFDLILTNTTTYQGWENGSPPYWFRFDGQELRQIRELPATARATGLDLPGDEAFFPLLGESPSDFWSDHRVLPALYGLELFVRSPEWAGAFPMAAELPQWTYLGYLPFDQSGADMHAPAVEFLRGHLEQLSSTASGYPNSAAYQIVAVSHGPDETGCADHPDADALLFMSAHESGAVIQNRVVVEPDTYMPIGLHPGEDFTLLLGDLAIPLGCGDAGLLGEPVQQARGKLDVLPGSDVTYQSLSRWYSEDYAEGADYLFYPDSGAYRLVNLSTRRSDALTARGIGVGSTAAELFTAYPELDQHYDAAPSYVAFFEEGDRQCSIEFYLDARGETPDQWIVSQLVLFTPLWYDPACSP